MAIWNQTDIDNLKAALSSGVLEVSFDGPPQRTVKYQSLRDMRDLLASMIADVYPDANSNYSLAETSKGFYVNRCR